MYKPTMDAERQDPPIPPRRRSLAELARLFGRLGVTAFGPAAHVAMMRHELVGVRRWLSDGDFLDLVGASNAIPGPTSTEVALHVGRRHAGIPGLLIAGAAFILPAAIIWPDELDAAHGRNALRARLALAPGPGTWPWHLALAPGPGTWPWHLARRPPRPFAVVPPTTRSVHCPSSTCASTGAPRAHGM